MPPKDPLPDISVTAIIGRSIWAGVWRCSVCGGGFWSEIGLARYQRCCRASGAQQVRSGRGHHADADVCGRESVDVDDEVGCSECEHTDLAAVTNLREDSVCCDIAAAVIDIGC